VELRLVEDIRMRRHAVTAAAVALAVIAVACEDVPAPSSKGNRAVGVEVQEAEKAKAAPTTEEGVVPKLIGVSVGDAKKAIVAAGFKTGEIDTVGLFGTPTNNWLVCEQVPAGGESPEKGTAVDLTADSKAC
jgi:hypothetical protein